MNTLILLLGMLLCSVTVYGKYLEENNSPDPVFNAGDESDGARKHGVTSQNRHRRKRWQSSYNYDYPFYNPYLYPERKQFDRNQQDLMPKVVSLLEEILMYISRPPPPPPPPQPIYIPYPVPYYVPQYAPCLNKEPEKVNISSRFPEMEDTNQNWGFVKTELRNDGGGFVWRPISFDPIKPKRPINRPPIVEHGSETFSQGDQSTQAPKFDEDNETPALGTTRSCSTAVVLCCMNKKEQQKVCFETAGCGLTYENGNGCSPDSIADAIKAVQNAYAPVTN